MASRLFQRIACSFGLHHPPPARRPPGPVVAECISCGKVVYYYGLAASQESYPVLLAPEFPKVVRALSPPPRRS